MFFKQNTLTNYFLKENIFLSLTLFFLPISIGLSSISLVASLAYCLYATIVNFNRLHKFQKFHIGICTLFFLYVLINSAFNNGYQQLLKYLPVLFITTIGMPIVFDGWKRVLYFNYLNYGIIISILVSIVRYLFVDFDDFTYFTLENVLNVHPTYYSLFLLIAINHLLFGENLKKKKDLFLLVLFIILVVFIRSRIALISLAVIGFVYLVYSLKSKKIFIGVLMFVGLLTSSLIVSGTIKGKTTFKLALAERIQIWESASELIVEKPVFGHGIDQEFNQLAKNFLFSAKLNLLDERFNSHNLYLSILIQLGGLGLLLGMLSFGYPIIKQSFNVEFTSYLIIVGIFGLTESFIFRHWGVIVVLITGIYADKIGIKNRY